MIPVRVCNKYPAPDSIFGLHQVVAEIPDPGTTIHNKQLFGFGDIDLKAGGVSPELHIFFVGTGGRAPNAPEPQLHTSAIMWWMIKHLYVSVNDIRIFNT